MRAFVMLLLLCAAVPVQAAVLWEQLPLLGQTAHVDQEFPDFSTYSTYQVHDVSVGAGGWVITSVTGFFTPNWANGIESGQARLNIFAKTGSMPGAGDNPTLGIVGTADFGISDPAVKLVTLGGLDVALTPGDYWIGLTPIVGFAAGGQGFHQVTAPIIGDYSAVRNPGGAFGFGTGWTTYASLSNGVAGDGAVRIEGRVGGGPVVPEPSTLALLSVGLGSALAFARRRR